MRLLFACVFFAIPQLLWSQYTPLPLYSEIDRVQPMTGLVMWSDAWELSTDAVQLEYEYMLYDEVVQDSGVYDWTPVENLLDAAAARGRQMIMRFRFVYPGYSTSVPQYIKDLPDYNETHSTSEGQATSFPDWTHPELERFTLEFYSKFAERYDNDPRLAFMQTGFGLWSEYHIYDGPFILGETFPSTNFQEEFARHLDSTFQDLRWSISIDAIADYGPFYENPEMIALDFGLFDDSFMHQTHDDYNLWCWTSFGLSRWQREPAGGEFSYYTAYDQEHMLDADGPYGISWEEASADFHISYIIANDQPLYQTEARIQEAGIAAGYKFTITQWEASEDSLRGAITNSGVAPLYYDAWPTLNGVRSSTNLKALLPGDTMLFSWPYNGGNADLSIEADRLVAGQSIQYAANLDAVVPVQNAPSSLTSGVVEGGHFFVMEHTQQGIFTAPYKGRLEAYTLNGRLLQSHDLEAGEERKIKTSTTALSLIWQFK